MQNLEPRTESTALESTEWLYCYVFPIEMTSERLRTFPGTSVQLGRDDILSYENDRAKPEGDL